MSRARVLFFALTVAPFGAQAAELTRIASSFDPDHPFGMYLDVGFERNQEKEQIVRELHQGGTVQDVNELSYLMTESKLNVGAHIGLYQDLEFYFGVPFVFSQNRQWGFAGGTTPANSTITNNCLQANGNLLDPNCPSTGAGAAPMFAVPAQSWRSGLGNLTFGLRYAIFNQKRDDTKPMWLVAMDYQAPTASLNDPSTITTASNPGNIGDKVHRYTFWTALSRRVGVADPYFKIHFTLPYLGPGWYSNCDNPSPTNMGTPQNCGATYNGQVAWTRQQTGEQPPYVGGIIFGTELNAYDEPAHHQKVAIDLRGIATYVSEGRYYNEMSDLFGKLMYTQEYAQLGGQFGLYAHAADFVSLQLVASLLYNTEHTLTYESIGKDLNGNGVVDVTSLPVEVNPNFDYRTDMVSRQFRATQDFVFTLSATATFSF